MSIHGPPDDAGLTALSRLFVLVAEVAICICALFAATHKSEE